MAYVRPLFKRGSKPGDPGRRPIGYEVRYRDGDGVLRTKGGFRRRREADAWAADLETSRTHGMLIPHSRSSTRLGEVADEWLASIQGRRRPKTVDGYEKLLKVHVRPAFGRRSVGSIAYADVDRFVRSIEALGRRPATARNAFFVLKMVLDHAVRSGRLRHNPCAGVNLPSPGSPEMLFLTASQVRVLAAAVDERWPSKRRRHPDAPPPYGLLIEFAAFTGLRSGEIAALRIGDVDLRAGTIRVSRSAAMVRGRWVEGEPKTKAGRRSVVINAALAERLVSHLGDRILDRDGYVFAAPDGARLNYGTFYSLHFKPTVAAVLPPHLHGLRFHDLRHSYASLLVAEGAHPKEMAELMGHSSVQITLDRYSHMMPHMAATLAERLDATYRGAEPAAADLSGPDAEILHVPPSTEARM
jgi:integrase